MSSVKRTLRYDKQRDEVVEVTPDTPATRSEATCGPAYSVGNPLVSAAFSCHRDQVEEYREFARVNGLSGVEYRDDGTCLITDRGDRGRLGLLRASGRHDNDGGYGDG